MHTLAGAIPNIVTGVAMVAVAAWLLTLNSRLLTNRVFALLLIVRGVTIAFASYPIFHDRPTAEMLVFILGAGDMALPFIAVAFGLAYPRERALVRDHRWIWVLITAGVVIVETIYLFQPGLYATIEERPEGGFQFASEGALFPFIALQVLLYSALGLIFARDFAEAPPGPLRTGLLLVSAGFAAGGAYTGALHVGLGVAGTPIFGPVTSSLEQLSLLPALSAVFVIRRELEFLTDAERRGAKLFMALTIFAAATGFIAAVWNPLLVGGIRPRLTLFSFWRLTIPILVTYALVRHQLYDIDLKAKITIRKGTVAAIFLAVFFVVAQVAQGFLTTEYGLILGGVTAGLLLFALAPIQRVAERVANAALPGVEDSSGWRSQKKEDSFRFAVRMALADKMLSREEERGLAKLALDLGIDGVRALELREEVERELGVAS